MKKRVASKAQILGFFGAIKPIEYKNKGGCLLFCYAFYLWLEKNGYDTSVYSITQYCAPWEDTIPQNEGFIKGHNDKATSATHFTWTYDGKEYDSDGLVKKGDKPPYMNHHQFNELCQTDIVHKFCENALRNGNWNEMFDREKGIKILKEKLGINIPKSIGIKIDPDTGYVIK